jgi:photosystem II stability/assembly factor-like uncharacterized protein
MHRTSRTILKTSNGGIVGCLHQAGYFKFVWALINANTGFAVGDNGRILKTTNGAKTGYKDKRFQHGFMTSIL